MNIFFFIIIVPMAGAFILPMVGRFSERIRNGLALLMVLTSFTGSALMVPLVFNGGAVTLIGELPLGFNLVLVADSLAIFMALVSSLIGAIIVFYSFGYIRHYDNRNEYYMMVVLFLGSMMGIVYSANLIFLYIFWELTALASWRLTGFFRERDYVLKADKAFLVTAFGALAMLLGFLIIYLKTGSFDLPIIKDTLSREALPNLAVLLILIGILSKSATLPFHTWLPDAGVAPSPVTALLHAAVLVKIGVYVFARLFIATFTFGDIWFTVVPYIASASALVSAGAALVETDMTRIIAYSTVSQIAFIFLGFSVGNGIGMAGALLYILMHGVAKGGLFLCAGIVEQNTKTKDITKMGGLIQTMPVTAVSFMFCAFSVMGIPPFGGFFSKYLVMSGAANTGDMWLVGTFLLGAILTILYLFRIFNMIFLGESKCVLAREGSKTMVVSVALLGALALFSGIYINYPGTFAHIVVRQIFGM